MFLAGNYRFSLEYRERCHEISYKFCWKRWDRKNCIVSIYRPLSQEAMTELPAAGESALMKPRISVHSHIVPRQLLHVNGVHHRFQCRQKPLNPHLLQPTPPRSNEKASDIDVKAPHHKEVAAIVSGALRSWPRPGWLFDSRWEHANKIYQFNGANSSNIWLVCWG